MKHNHGGKGVHKRVSVDTLTEQYRCSICDKIANFAKHIWDYPLPAFELNCLSIGIRDGFITAKCYVFVEAMLSRKNKIASPNAPLKDFDAQEIRFCCTGNNSS